MTSITLFSFHFLLLDFVYFQLSLHVAVANLAQGVFNVCLLLLSSWHYAFRVLLLVLDFSPTYFTSSLLDGGVPARTSPWLGRGRAYPSLLPYLFLLRFFQVLHSKLDKEMVRRRYVITSA